MRKEVTGNRGVGCDPLRGTSTRTASVKGELGVGGNNSGKSPLLQILLAAHFYFLPFSHTYRSTLVRCTPFLYFVESEFENRERKRRSDFHNPQYHHHHSSSVLNTTYHTRFVCEEVLAVVIIHTRCQLCLWVKHRPFVRSLCSPVRFGVLGGNLRRPHPSL